MEINFSEEQKMLHSLLLNITKTQDIGILNGLMGSVILLYHYDRYSGQNYCSDLAGDLLDKVWENVNTNTPITFDSGLCGIGWGTEYLIQNGFVEGDGAEICKEINSRIMREDPKRIDNMSLENGMEGILHYILIHIQGCVKNTAEIGFDDIYLSDIYQKINSIPKDITNENLKRLINLYNNIYKYRENNTYKAGLQYFIEEPKESQSQEENIDGAAFVDTGINQAVKTDSYSLLSIGLRCNFAYNLISGKITNCQEL